MASAVPNSVRSIPGLTNELELDIVGLQSNIARQRPDVIAQQTVVEQSGNTLPPALEEEEELLVSEHLLQAMTCPVCLRVYNNPVLLRCGHSFCNECAGNIRKYAGLVVCHQCSICRFESEEPPVVNYALKDLVDRIKEQEVLNGLCHSCSKHLKFEEQYCCNDCDRRNQREDVLCVVCALKHAQERHEVSKMGETEERIELARDEIGNIQRRAKQYVDTAKQYTSQRLNSVEDLLKVLSDNLNRFEAIQSFLSSTCNISKKEVTERMARGARLLDIYSASASEYVEYLANFTSQMSLLVERAKNEFKAVEECENCAAWNSGTNQQPSTAFAGANGMAENGVEACPAAQSQQLQSLSPLLFEYQRSLRPLQSLLERRNATLARRNPPVIAARNEVGQQVTGVRQPDLTLGQLLYGTSLSSNTGFSMVPPFSSSYISHPLL